MPEASSLREIADEIGVLAALREAEDDIRGGRVRPIEEVRSLIPGWIAKSSSPTAPSRI
jgi:hypothetical protein